MTEVGETSAPTTTGPIDDAHRALAARLLEHLIVHGPAIAPRPTAAPRPS